MLNSNSKVETIAISKDKQRFPRRKSIPEQGQTFDKTMKTPANVGETSAVRTYSRRVSDAALSLLTLCNSTEGRPVPAQRHKRHKGASEAREVSVLGSPLPLSQLSPLLTPGYGSDPSEPTPPDPGRGRRHIPTRPTK